MADLFENSERCRGKAVKLVGQGDLVSVEHGIAVDAFDFGIRLVKRNNRLQKCIGKAIGEQNAHRCVVLAAHQMKLGISFTKDGKLLQRWVIHIQRI